MMAHKQVVLAASTMQRKAQRLPPVRSPAPSEPQHKTCREEKALPKENLTKRGPLPVLEWLEADCCDGSSARSSSTTRRPRLGTYLCCIPLLHEYFPVTHRVLGSEQGIADINLTRCVCFSVVSWSRKKA